MLRIYLYLFSPLSCLLSPSLQQCPLPRDNVDDKGEHIVFENTGNKEGPCGPYSGKIGMSGVTTLTPGWHTLIW